MPPTETYKSEIGSQSTMCQVHTGAYVSLLALAPGKKQLYRLPPKKNYHVYIKRGIYHYAHAQQTQVNWKKETKNKEERGKEMCAWGQEKEKKETFRGSTGDSATRTGCHVFFRRSTAVLRTTSDTPTEARTTGQLRDRQLAGVVTCFCVGGPCALPLVCACLGKTCGVLDDLTAAAHQNVCSYDVSLLQEM